MSQTDDASLFFQNYACPYFPCHSGIRDEQFNCLFCYCPLYVLGRRCGGNCTYTEQGVKSCMECTFPHEKDNYDKVLARYEEIVDAVRRIDALGTGNVD